MRLRLLENYLTEEETQLAMIRSAQPVRLSDVFGESGVLRSFSEEYLLKEFGHSLQELK